MRNKAKLAYKPPRAIHPGRSLQNNLEYYGLSQKWLAEHTGLSEKHISDIINGIATITPDTAVKIAHVFNESVQYWTNLDAHYRTTMAMLAQEKSAKSEIPYLREIPYRDMVRAGWVEPTHNTLEKVINLYGFFGVSSLKNIPITQTAAFRKFSSCKINKYAMAAWLRRGEVLALEKADYADFDKDKLRQALPIIKEIIYELPSDFFRQIADILADCGVVLIAVKYLPDTYVNGATRWVGKHPVIQLSDRRRNDDQLWFTLFHEIGHILLHGKKKQFLNLDSENSGQEVWQQEKAADDFAAEQLLSTAQFKQFILESDGNFTEEKIKSFAEREKIAPSIIVGRLKHYKYIAWNRFNYMHKEICIAE